MKARSMTKLEELKAAWEAAWEAATDAGEAEADDAWANNFIARAAYRAELEKTYKENSNDQVQEGDGSKV
jgi:hypothetical protein